MMNLFFQNDKHYDNFSTYFVNNLDLTKEINLLNNKIITYCDLILAFYKIKETVSKNGYLQFTNGKYIFWVNNNSYGNYSNSINSIFNKNIYTFLKKNNAKIISKNGHFNVIDVCVDCDSKLLNLIALKLKSKYEKNIADENKHIKIINERIDACKKIRETENIDNINENIRKIENMIVSLKMSDDETINYYKKLSEEKQKLNLLKNYDENNEDIKYKIYLLNNKILNILIFFNSVENGKSLFKEMLTDPTNSAVPMVPIVPIEQNPLLQNALV